MILFCMINIVLISIPHAGLFLVSK